MLRSFPCQICVKFGDNILNKKNNKNKQVRKHAPDD